MKQFFGFCLMCVLLTCCISPSLGKPVVIDGDVPVEGGFRRVTLAQGLEHPWSMAWLPNGDLLITERPGRLRLMRNGRLLKNPISGVREVYAGGQGGLLDIRLHPLFKENRRLFLTYAHGSLAANRTRVATATLKGMNLENWRDIFEVSTPKAGRQHFGSRLAWLPDGTLLVSIGDGGNPPVRLDGDWIRKQAQNKASHLGKIVRINIDGSVPADNPFVNTADADPFVWSYGHRNIQGLVFDPLRDAVWASEHGALGGDELNQVRGGQNYGWPAVTYSREYVGGLKISEHTSRPGMQDPLVVWTNAIAPSGLEVYTGKQFLAWRGDLFVGGLKSQDIRRIDLDSAGRVLAQSALRIGQRVREVRQGPDGLLYVLTDEPYGSLIRLEPIRQKELPEPP
jgi:glucose/arabinose dehydrogenase